MSVSATGGKTPMTASTPKPARTRVVRVACLTVLTVLLGLVAAGPASAQFGLKTFTSDFRDPSGSPVTQAGAHADVSTYFHFNSEQVPADPPRSAGGEKMFDQVRDTEVDLPAGF